MADDLAGLLLGLGFSAYEARCYAGLVGGEPRTGYAVSQITGVPQPKVYEALRRLAARGAAVRLAGDPARFVAVPPGTLFDQMQETYAVKIAAARQAAVSNRPAPADESAELLPLLADRPAVLAAATTLLAAAERRVYLSGTAPDLGALADPLRTAAGRGVDLVILHFRELPFTIDGAHVFRHESTEKAIYRHHQARHLALVGDSREVIWALARDGRQWHGLHSRNDLLVAAIKGYVRHDIDLQQIYAGFGPELERAYGPGLQALEHYRRPAEQQRPTEQRRREAG
ncbi:TrmB family transcriptional regulator [Actinoplanes sp. L3-i22]|uniref:TrmB family transcriptional regulator n=1 Tax=Actinoplanes sp. L3-i22 TaxID=2836373 RepID=UPI001C7640FC|nr:helix-turn-helix domain-containing protein [Actinoplanes sp. L3-i22]BCY12110.1 transcriptional regulator [Actinoplanes sp. L3-i22]